MVVHKGRVAGQNAGLAAAAIHGQPLIVLSLLQHLQHATELELQDWNPASFSHLQHAVVVVNGLARNEGVELHNDPVGCDARRMRVLQQLVFGQRRVRHDARHHVRALRPARQKLRHTHLVDGRVRNKP